MSSHTQEALAPVVERDAAIPIVQVIRGRVETGGERLYRSRDLGAPLAAPAADLNAWVFPRSEPQPAMNLPIGEVMDFLGELGARLDLDRNDHLRRAFELAGRVNVLGAKALELGVLTRALPFIEVNSFSPPLSMTRSEAEEAVEIYGKALDTVTPELTRLAAE